MGMSPRDALQTLSGLAGAATLGNLLPACSDDGRGAVGITTYVYSMHSIDAFLEQQQRKDEHA